MASKQSVTARKDEHFLNLKPDMNIHHCYCYNENCNQIEWEKQGKTGKRQYTVVQDVYSKGLGLKTPVCPYCKKKMIVTADLRF